MTLKKPIEPLRAEQTEFEIKSELRPDFDIDALLEGTKPEHERLIVDDYIDNITYELFKVGVFMRVRNEKQLDIKYNPEFNSVHHKSSESSFRLPLDSQSDLNVGKFLGQFLRPYDINEKSVFSKYGLTSLVRIEKVRTTYKRADVEISIDNVKGLGQFVEIEASEIEGCKRAKELSSKFGLKHLQTGYVELMLRKTNYELYKKGKYLLKKDKSK